MPEKSFPCWEAHPEISQHKEQPARNDFKEILFLWTELQEHLEAAENFMLALLGYICEEMPITRTLWQDLV